MKTKSVKELQRQWDKVDKLDMPETDKCDTLEGIEGEIAVAAENEEKLKGLTTLEGWDKTLLFTEKKNLDSLLESVADAARSIVWDASTPEGRKEGASIARKVSSAKVTADSYGKTLTDEWAKKKKAVDAGRATIRKTLDNLRDEIKAPIEAWKKAEADKVAKEKLEREFAADHEEALSRDDLYNREAAVREAEAKIAADKLIEDTRLEAERLEEERVQVAQDAAAQAVEDERVRVATKKANDLREEQARARDKEHRRSINQAAVTALVAAGISEEDSQKVITAIATGMVPSVKIQY